MNSIADLGIRVDSSQAGAAAAELDKLVPAAKRAEMATEELAKASVTASAAARDEAAAVKTVGVAATGAAAATARMTTATTAAAVAATKAGSAYGIANHQLTNLSYQINDIGTMLAMGASPFQIMASQGGQVYQILGSHPQGVGGAVKELGGRLGGMVTIGRLAFGGIIAGGIAAAVVLNKAVADQKALEAALLGTGRAAGVTAEQLAQMANTAAEAAQIGAGEAREMAIEYARSGAVAGENIQRLTAITKDFAATAGMEASEAVAFLSSAMGNLTTGLDKVNSAIGFLDADTREHILTLEAQGRHNEAVAATLDAMQPHIASHGDQLTWIGRRWNEITVAASNALQASADYFTQNDQREIAALKMRLDQVNAAIMTPSRDGTPQAEVDAQDLELKEESKRLTLEIAAIQDRGRAATAAAEQARVEAEQRRLSVESQAIATRVTGTEAVTRLLNDQAKLLAQQSAGFPGMNPDQIANTQQALEKLEGQIKTLSSAKGDLIVQGQRYLSQEQIAAAKSAEADAAKAAREGEMAAKEAQREAEKAERQRLADLAAAERFQVEQFRFNDRMIREGLKGEIGGVEGSIILAKQEEAAMLMEIDRAMRDGLIASEEEYNELRVALSAQTAQRIQDIYASQATAQLQMGEAMFGDLADMVGTFAGKSSAAYKVLFGISKAFAIAEATINLQKAISNALALPWPANLPAIAQAVSLGTSIIGNIASIAAPKGYARGVIGLNGPGTGTSDSIPAMLSRGESVITAAATERNRPALAAMNAGATIGSSVKVIHDGSTAIDIRETSRGEMEVIARTVLRREGPSVAAASQRDPNGMMAKATRDTIRASRRRS